MIDQARAPLPPEEPRLAVAAFFDVDNTLIRGASAYHLVLELSRRRMFGPRDVAFFTGHALRYLALGEDVSQLDPVSTRALSLIRGRSGAEVAALAAAVYDDVLARRTYPGAIDLLDRHRAAGHQVWLVTAGPQEVVELVAERIGATGGIGTAAEYEDGLYTGRLAGPVMHGEQKAEAVRALAGRVGIDLARSYAYGDSSNDIPMLSAVGHPCAVNPEPRLMRYCAEVGWPVREFRLRHSRTGRRVGRAVGASSLAWAAALVARAVRARLRARTGG